MKNFFSCALFVMFFVGLTPFAKAAETDQTKSGQKSVLVSSQGGQAILIRSTPAQAAAETSASSGASVLSSASYGAAATADSKATAAKSKFSASSGRLVVCVSKGVEFRGLTPEECKAMDGRVTETGEAALMHPAKNPRDRPGTSS